MCSYKVLWFDDEHATLEIIKDEALQHGIELFGYENAKDGIEELVKNYWIYDAVILDGLFFKDSNQKGDTVDNKAFGLVANKLRELKAQGNIIPWFIFSGQPSFVKEKNDLVEVLSEEQFANGKVFDKNIDEDLEELCKEIKNACDNIDSVRIKHQYRDVFEVCTRKYIGEYAAKDLLEILSYFKNIDHGKYFTSIRKIIEDLFSAFNKFELLPKEFISPNIALNESSKFLSGKAMKGYSLNQNSHLPQVISNNLRNILSVTQPASHRSHIDDHLNLVNTNYLIKSIVYQLLDVIVWFKKHVDSKPDTENWNRENITSNDSISNILPGIVINYNNYKGFAFFKPNNGGENIFIPPHLVESHKLKEGMPIGIESEEYTDNRTQEIKVRAKKIEL